MPWFGLVGVIGWNYSVHRRRLRTCPTGCDHWPHRTICATTRHLLPRHVSAALLALGYGYLSAHVWRGYPRRLKETL